MATGAHAVEDEPFAGLGNPAAIKPVEKGVAAGQDTGGESHADEDLCPGTPAGPRTEDVQMGARGPWVADRVGRRSGRAGSLACRGRAAGSHDK
jgi:hypothetical protein